MAVADEWDATHRCGSSSCTDMAGNRYDEGDRMPELWEELDELLYYGDEIYISVDSSSAGPYDEVYILDSVSSSSFYGYPVEFRDYVYSASKGSTYYGTVFSTSSSAYPANSYSGNYWYVRQ